MRRLAARLDLAPAARPDSQGICFLGKVKFNEFVREHLGDWPGVVVEAGGDQMVGFHKGFWYYTLG